VPSTTPIEWARTGEKVVQLALPTSNFLSRLSRSLKLHTPKSGGWRRRMAPSGLILLHLLDNKPHKHTQTHRNTHFSGSSSRLASPVSEHHRWLIVFMCNTTVLSRCLSAGSNRDIIAHVLDHHLCWQQSNPQPRLQPAPIPRRVANQALSLGLNDNKQSKR
jgi:hypothetical protein